VALKVPHLPIKGADKLGFLHLSCSNHYEHLAELGKEYINEKIALEKLLRKPVFLSF
jgi:hypothetical protein